MSDSRSQSVPNDSGQVSYADSLLSLQQNLLAEGKSPLHQGKQANINAKAVLRPVQRM
jgi:hypothetical protein